MIKIKIQQQRQRAFTLIELLVAVALMGLVMVVSVSFFFNSLKARKKNVSLTSVKQNGNYALSIISMMLRNAQEVSGACSLGMNEITILNKDRETTTFSCLGSNSPFNCSSGVSSQRIASYSASASRNDCLTASDISLSACSFDCSRFNGTPDSIIVQFTLTKGNPSDIFGYTSQDFKTSVSLRSY